MQIAETPKPPSTKHLHDNTKDLRVREQKLKKKEDSLKQRVAELEDKTKELTRLQSVLLKMEAKILELERSNRILTLERTAETNHSDVTHPADHNRRNRQDEQQNQQSNHIPPPLHQTNVLEARIQNIELALLNHRMEKLETTLSRLYPTMPPVLNQHFPFPMDCYLPPVPSWSSPQYVLP